MSNGRQCWESKGNGRRSPLIQLLSRLPCVVAYGIVGPQLLVVSLSLIRALQLGLRHIVGFAESDRQFAATMSRANKRSSALWIIWNA